MAKLAIGVSRKRVSGTLSYKGLFPPELLIPLLSKEIGKFSH